MKKILYSALLIFCLLFAALAGTACDGYMTDQQASEKKLKEVFSLIDKRDRDGLLSLYAKTARDENPNIGEQIDAFFEEIDGELTVEKFWCGGGVSAQYHYGKQARYPFAVNDVIIRIGEVRYQVNLIFCSINAIDKNKEGILILEFATEEAYASPYFVWRRNAPYNFSWRSDDFYEKEDDDLPGLYIQNSAEKRDDIIFIEKRAFIYRHFDRQLTKDMLIDAANQSDDYFGSFINIVGEPNSKWVIWVYYYYLLDDGTVATIVLNDDLLIDEQNVHIKKFDIAAIYLADKDTCLETIWLAPNIALDNDALDSGRSRYYRNNNAD